MKIRGWPEGMSAVLRRVVLSAKRRPTAGIWRPSRPVLIVAGAVKAVIKAQPTKTNRTMVELPAIQRVAIL